VLKKNPETPPVSEISEDKIKIVIRTPKHEKIMLELRHNVDCSVMKGKIEAAGYPFTSYELVRAYPRMKIDLSQGQTIKSVGIINQDLFHVQLRM
jgi:hypothetical protein